jgi:hypothetical protein
MGWFQVESIVESSEQVFGGISFSHISPTHVKKKYSIYTSWGCVKVECKSWFYNVSCGVV